MEIDLKNILIHCPDKGFNLRSANSCFTCGFYNGIMRATENGDPIPGNEADFYQISCNRPISRKLIKVLE